jgi:hypothetical protein
MSVVFEALDNVPPEGMSFEEFEALQERMAILQDKGTAFVEHYLVGLTSTSVEKRPDEAEDTVGYDFVATYADGTRLLCVKTTEGDFNTPIHISYNELLKMCESTPYDLYRVYDIADRRAELRIAPDMRNFAEQVLAIFEQLPDGVRPDSISVSPEVLNFGDR